MSARHRFRVLCGGGGFGVIAGVRVIIADQVKADGRGKDIFLMDQVKMKLVSCVKQVTHTQRMETAGIELVFRKVIRTTEINSFHGLATSIFYVLTGANGLQAAREWPIFYIK